MEIIFYLIPCLVAAIFSALLTMKNSKVLAVRFLISLLLIFSGFFLFDAFVVFRFTNGYFRALSYVFNAFLVPSIPLLFCFVAWSLTTTYQKYSKLTYVLLFVPVLLFLLEIVNYSTMGWSNVAEFYENGRTFPSDISPIQKHLYGIFEFVAIDLYNVVSSIIILVSLIFYIYIGVQTDNRFSTWRNFIFKRGPIRSIHLFGLTFFWMLVYFILRIGCQSVYLGQHSVISCLLSLYAAIGLGIMGWMGFYFHNPVFFLRKPHPIPKFQDLPVPVINPLELKGKHYEEFTVLAENDKYDLLSIKSSFENLMRDKHCFRYVGCSRYYVSQVLGIRKTSLDRVVELVFHVSYAEYVMVQRIEYCRRYRKMFPKESLVDVAMICGFSNLKEMRSDWRECQLFFDFRPLPENLRNDSMENLV